jgi:hypothetical protein
LTIPNDHLEMALRRKTSIQQQCWSQGEGI